MTYRYYSILRPVAPGTFPASKPRAGIKNFDDRTMIDSIGRMAWGYIDYIAPLTEDEARNYELIPEPTNGKRCGGTV